MAYWLVKSEPTEYSFSDLLREGRAIWDGVRNPQAQKYLKAMAVGDEVLYYHTGTERAIVGLAQVVRAAFPDPNAPAYSVVELAPIRALTYPVPLQLLKEDRRFADWALLRQPRLSVMPVPPQLWDIILQLSTAPRP